MLNTTFPRIPGDIGNATTFGFPVLYKIIESASTATVITDDDKAMLEPFIQGARELQALGVRAITTSCGFLAVFQREMAASVTVPVFTSSLLQAKFVQPMLAPGQKVGIITANSAVLGKRHFDGVGISDVPKVVAGAEDTRFAEMFFAGSNQLDIEMAERELVSLARDLVGQNPDVGAIVLECTNMPPYSSAIPRALNLPVFDIVTLVDYINATVVPRSFQGYM